MIKSGAQLRKKNIINVLLFVPNIIDYIRFVFILIAFLYARTNPNYFLFYYFFSFLLDEFDGILARRYKQISTFGAILDMIIDRISTNALLGILAILYSDYYYTLLMMMMLDIGSHWFQTHSAILELKPNVNHKCLKEKFWLLELYYSNPLILSVISWTAEIFLGQIYYLYFYENCLKNIVFYNIMFICLPFYILKQIISVLQILSAAERIIKYDLRKDE